MTTPTLILNSALMLVAASCAFIFGFLQAGIYPDAAHNSIFIGISSATAWGMGSMGASASFSGWTNIFAAMFAAMSLGFPRRPMTPAKMRTSWPRVRASCVPRFADPLAATNVGKVSSTTTLLPESKKPALSR